MFDKRILFALAFASLTGLAACGGETEEEIPVEETPAPTEVNGEPQIAPEVFEGATVMDTSNIGPVNDTPVSDSVPGGQ